MDEKELRAELAQVEAERGALDEQYAELNTRRREIEQKLCALLAKFPIGAHVNYSGKRFEISGHRWSGFTQEPVEYFGKLVKKDGSIGLAVRRLYMWDRSLQLWK